MLSIEPLYCRKIMIIRAISLSVILLQFSCTSETHKTSMITFTDASIQDFYELHIGKIIIERGPAAITHFAISENASEVVITAFTSYCFQDREENQAFVDRGTLVIISDTSRFNKLVEYGIETEALDIHALYDLSVLKECDSLRFYHPIFSRYILTKK